MGHNEGEVDRPLPGRPVRGSDSGRPMMAALDLFGRRWALRIVWELRFGKSRFSDLRNEIEGISSSTLSQRLSELSAAHIVAQTSDGAYRLSYQGKALLIALGPLELWAKAWAKAVRDGAPEDPADRA